MSEVSSGNVTTYRNATRTWVDPVLNLEPLDELATADVDTVPTYPITQIAVTNTSADWGDVVENMLFRIEQSDGTIVAWGVTRFDATASLFYPDVKSDGDFGYATNEGLTIAATDSIRVYKNRHIWAMISRVASNGVQYKRWNQVYAGEGRRPPPVVIMGADQQSYVDTGTSRATFAFDASDSYDWLQGTGGIKSFAYTLPAGAAVTGGAVNTDSVTFTITAGIHLVELLVTANNGATATGVRTVYANDLSGNLPFGETFAIQAIGSDITDINGWEAQFTVLGDASATLFPGQKCHWFVPVYYDGSRLTANNAFNDIFVGYLTDIRVQANDRGVLSTTLTFKSPLKVCQLLPSATQFIEEDATPNTWQQVAPGLSDPAYAAYYVLKFHTTVTDNHDFLHETAIRDLRRRVFGFPADNINAHLALAGILMVGDVGCRGDGTITLTQNPSLQDDTDRDARDEKFIWEDTDQRDRFVVSPRIRPEIAYLILAGVSYSGNPNIPMRKYASKAPGRAQAQGVTKSDLPAITLTIRGGATELYGIVGHMFAFLNNPLAQMDLFPAKMLDILTPADPDWHVLNVSESDYLAIDADTFGVRWATDMRFRPIRVNRIWQNKERGWTKQLTAQVRIESKGRPGVFHPVFLGQKIPYINPASGWVDNLSITMPDINIDFKIDLPTVDDWNLGWGFNNFGLSSFSSDWTDDIPTYSSTNTGISGDVIDQSFDGARTSPQAAFMLVWDESETDLVVYENTDIESDPTDWSVAATIDMSGQGFQGKARIVTNASVAMVAIITPTRMLVYRKPAAGAWDAGVTVGDVAAADTVEADKYFGVALDGTNQWVPGREDTNDGYRVYKATGVAAAFVVVANHPGDNANSLTNFPAIIRSGTDIIVSFGSLDATAAGEVRDLTDMDENRIVSIPDRERPPTGVQWSEGVPWWTESSFGANGIPGQYGRAFIDYTDENAAGISYTVSVFGIRVETIAIWVTATGSEVSVDMTVEVRLLNKNKEVLWSSGELNYNTTADGQDLDTTVGWDTTLTRRYRGYTITSTPASPVSGVVYWEVLNRSTNLETLDIIAGGSQNWPEFFVSNAFTFGAIAPEPTWTIDSKEQTGGRLYSIDDATSTWTEITPFDPNDGQLRTPQRYNAINLQGSEIRAIVINESGEKEMVYTTDGGVNWIEDGSVKYDWFRFLGATDKAVLGGDELLDLTTDDFKTLHKRLGNWSVLGSIGTILDFESIGLL